MDFFMPEGKRFGDFSLIEHDGRLYCVFIENVRTAAAISGGVSVGNCLGMASSDDGFNWTYLGTILKPGDSPATEWKNRNLWAPDIFEHDGKFMLVYSGVSSAGDDVFKTQQVGISESTDLLSWQDVTSNPRITQSDTGEHYYGVSHPRFCWRDPNVLKIGDWLYCTLSGRDAHMPYERSGCVALLRSKDLRTWETLPAPFSPGTYFEIETSTIYKYMGRYLLLFGHYTHGHCMSYAWSDSIDGPFHETLNNVLTPSFVYAGKVVQWRGQWRFYHWIRDPIIGKFETRLAVPKQFVVHNDSIHLEILNEVRDGVLECTYADWIAQAQSVGAAVCRCLGTLTADSLKISVNNSAEAYSRRIVIMPSHGGLLISDNSCSDSVNDVRTIPFALRAGSAIELFKFGPVCELYIDSVFVHSFYLTGNDAVIEDIRIEGGAF